MNDNLCSRCLMDVNEVRIRFGRAAAITERERVDPTCNNHCRCGRRIRCDEEFCMSCVQRDMQDMRNQGILKDEVAEMLRLTGPQW